MQEYKIGLNGLNCASCEKIVSRVAAANNAQVKEIDEHTGYVTVVCEENVLDTLKKQFAEKGFVERKIDDSERGDLSRVLNYFSSILSGGQEVIVESTLLNFSLASIAAIILLGTIISFFAANLVEGYNSYVPFFFLTALFSIMAVFSYTHMRCYKKSMSCSVGMMVGMTVGMISGFMAGALIGATNGMFAGSVVGMLLGIGIGVSLGRHCGIMGAMEGIMAGFMAGIMGAMTSIMLFADNLVIFLYIVFGICVVVLAGLSYMMHREAGSALRENLKTNMPNFVIASIVLSAVLIAIMLFGPKAALVYV